MPEHEQPHVGETAPGTQPEGAGHQTTLVVESPAMPVVPGSHLCITCGYQLSGLPLDGLCPECSTRVQLSLTRPSLLTDPIEHVRTLRRGAGRLISGTALFIGSAVIILPFVNVFRTPPSTSWQGLLTAVFIALHFISISVMFWGVRDYTKENPHPDAAKLLEPSRANLVRTSAILFGFSLTGTSTLLAMLAPPDRGVHFVWGLLFQGGLITWLFQVLGVMRYTSKLAGSVPDQRLVDRARMLGEPILGFLLLGLVTWGLASMLGVTLYLFVLQRMHGHLGRIIATREAEGP